MGNSVLPHNATVYGEIVPQIARVAPEVPILVVTDPPDPLADIARKHTATSPIISAGTYLDTLRFRLQIGQRLGCHPSSVDAIVIGEHGTSQVYVWSSAHVMGRPVLEWAADREWDRGDFRREIETAVRYANIDIIEGTGASQHGIGIVTARIVEAMVRDEGLVAPVGTAHPELGVTRSLPSVIGSGGVVEVLRPALSPEEARAFERSAKAIKDALRSLS